MPKLAHLLNRPVIVAIPAFFGDDAPRRCTLLEIDQTGSGYWFTGHALNDQLGRYEDTAPPDDTLATVFFPFDKILYVFDPTQFAHLARGVGSGAKPKKLDEPPNQAAHIHPRGRRDRPSKHKGSKSKR